MPKPFETYLINKGFPETRVSNIWNGFDELHAAIAKLDCETLKMFWEHPLDEYLKEFAKREGLRNVVPIEGEDICTIR